MKIWQKRLEFKILDKWTPWRNVEIRSRYWDNMQLWHRHNLFFSNDYASSRIWSNLFRTTTFSENLLLHSKHFFRAVRFWEKQVRHNSYFFQTAISSQLLLFWNRNFFRSVTLSQQLFFCRIAAFLKLNFKLTMRIDNYIGKLLFWISKEKLLFWSTFFYTASNFSERLLFQQN